MTTPPVEDIQQAVCHRFGIRLIEMSSHRRGRKVARPRQIAMYLARELTPLSLAMIGRLFGDRDHTTIVHACQVVEGLCRQDRDFAAVVDELLHMLAEPDPELDQLTLPLVMPRQVAAAQNARLLVV